METVVKLKESDLIRSIESALFKDKDYLNKGTNLLEFARKLFIYDYKNFGNTIDTEFQRGLFEDIIPKKKTIIKEYRERFDNRLITENEKGLGYINEFFDFLIDNAVPMIEQTKPKVVPKKPVVPANVNVVMQNLHKAFDGAGTDEESLFGAFNSLKDGTASDACALINKYNQQYGDLYEDLDGDIDSPDEWNKIYRPLRDCIEDSLKGLVAEDPCKDSPGTVWDEKTKSCVGVVPVTNTKWKDCPNFPLTKGCKGEKVSKIQDCLGELVVDGKFGSDTEKALKSKKYDVIITQEIYDKIIANCGTTTTNTIYTPDRNEMGNNDLNK